MRVGTSSTINRDAILHRLAYLKTAAMSELLISLGDNVSKVEARRAWDIMQRLERDGFVVIERNGTKKPRYHITDAGAKEATAR